MAAGRRAAIGSRFPRVDARAAELLFRHKVLSLLRKAGLIDGQRIALLLSWNHTGFSVHNSVSVQSEDAEASERLVRYVMRAPVSQQRLDLDPDEVVARILVQIPEPGKHLIHSDGRYANVARAKRRRDAAAEHQSLTATAAGTTPAERLDSLTRG